MKFFLSQGFPSGSINNYEMLCPCSLGVLKLMKLWLPYDAGGMITWRVDNVKILDTHSNIRSAPKVPSNPPQLRWI